MTKFARLRAVGDEGNRVVIETVDADDRAALELMFHPDLAVQFIEVPSAAVAGSIKNGQTWIHPEAVAAQPLGAVVPARRTVVNRVEFKQLFTIQEQVAIRMARAYSGAEETPLTLKHTLDAFYDVLDDSQLVTINLAVPMVVGGLALLEQSGLIGESRAAEIGEGVAQ